MAHHHFHRLHGLCGFRHWWAIALAVVAGVSLAPVARAAETDSEFVVQGLDPMEHLMRRFRAGPAVDAAAWTNAPTITWPGLAVLTIDPAEVKDNCIGFVIPARDGDIIDLTAEGQWAELRDGSRVCRVKIHAPDAKGTRLKMFDLDLPEGATLTLGDAVNGEVFGQYEGRGLLLDGEFWTATVPGEMVLVEIAIPAAEVNEPIVAEVSDLLHDFIDLFAAQADAGVPPDGSELPCHEDVACFLDADNPRRASVVKLSFIVGSSGFTCSGSTLADSDPDTQIPWLLTANHCLNTQESAESLEAIFFHELESCDVSTRRTRVVTEGAGLIAATSQSDVVLMRLVKPIPVGGALVGFKSDSIQTGGITIVHHPRGTRKRYGEGRVVQDSFCRSATNFINVNLSGGIGFSEGGSSGSPLFNGTGKVIGQLFGVCLTGPGRDCAGSSQLPHVYGRLSSSFSTLNLDPILAQPDPDDTFEPNNSFGQARLIKEGMFNMKMRDADDYYFVNLEIEGDTSISVSYDTSVMSLGLSIMSESGDLLATAANTGSPLVLQLDLEAQRYWIRVRRIANGGAYDLAIDFDRVAGDVTGNDTVDVDDLIVVLRTFGDSCTAGVAGCGDVTGDGFVDFSDVRLLLETMGLRREDFDTKTWKKQAKTLAKQMKIQLKAIDKNDRKLVKTRLKSVPTAQVDQVLRMLANFGRTCQNPDNCADVTGDNRITADDLRIALSEAGFDRDAFDDRQWTKTISKFFKKELRKSLANYPFLSQGFALRILTTLRTSTPPAQ